jgi:transcriptional regulator GlxA family with amidase domain
MPHDVVIVSHPLVLGMELMGALDLQHFANQALIDAGKQPYYRVHLVSLDGGPIRTWSGFEMTATERLTGYEGPIDTLVVVGGLHAHEVAEDPALIAEVRRAGQRAGRIVGLCTGAFILAAAGLLEGKRATTHWAFGELLATRHPETEVDTDPIYIGDGNTWTSAGITATLDLLLALVSDDLGAESARGVARYLVMFLHRTGNQAQFSVQLAAQMTARQPIRELQQFIADHPDADLTLPRLAERVQMSERHFARVFTTEVGMTPGRYVEQVRLETARRRLEEGDQSVEAIALATGFGTAESMRRAFGLRLGVSPTEYRRTFGPPARHRLEPLVS